MEFGARLKLFRNNERLTQGALAKKIGVSDKTISSWEVGRTEPSMGDIASLCKVFGCTQGELVGTSSKNITLEDVMKTTDLLSLDDMKKLYKLLAIKIHHKEEVSSLELELKRKKQEYADSMQRELTTLEFDDLDLAFLDIR